MLEIKSLSFVWNTNACLPKHNEQSCIWTQMLVAVWLVYQLVNSLNQQYSQWTKSVLIKSLCKLSNILHKKHFEYLGGTKTHRWNSFHYGWVPSSAQWTSNAVVLMFWITPVRVPLCHAGMSMVQKGQDDPFIFSPRSAKITSIMSQKVRGRAGGVHITFSRKARAGQCVKLLS